MKVELEITAQVEVYKRGKPILVNKILKKLFDVTEIEVEEFIDAETGKILKEYTGVLFRDKYYKVNIPYKQFTTNIINNNKPILGFYGYSNAYKKENKIRKS